MKITHIIGIIVIAIAIAIIASTAGDASVYTNFGTAQELAKNGNDGQVHVVGTVKKDAQGKVMDVFYDPAIDPNHFEFTLIDNKNTAEKVIYNSPKPQDFGSAEQIVVIGAMKADHFQCSKILLKCPSKYENGKLETTEYESNATPGKTARL